MGHITIGRVRDDLLQPSKSTVYYKNLVGWCGGPHDVPVQEDLAEMLVVISPPWGHIFASGVDNYTENGTYLDA